MHENKKILNSQLPVWKLYEPVTLRPGGAGPDGGEGAHEGGRGGGGAR